MPLKGKQVELSEQSFLFVNEDFNTLFRGVKSAATDRSKQSHVQRQSFAKRRKQLQRRTGSASTIAASAAASVNARASGDVSSLVPSIGRSISEDNVTARASDVATPFWRTSSSIPEEPTYTAELNGETARNPSIALWDSVQWQNTPTETFDFSSYEVPQPSSQDPDLPQPNAELQSLSLEPTTDSDVTRSRSPHFTPSVLPYVNDATCTEVAYMLERWVPALMKYHTTVMIPEAFWADTQAVPLELTRHADALHADMRSCMSNAAEMYAFLAATCCYVLWREQGQFNVLGQISKDPHQVGLLFKTKALEALGSRLRAGDIDHGVAIAVNRMVVAATIYGSPTAVETHYHASISMVESLGGILTFNNYHQERIIACDILQAMRFGTRPRLDQVWDPGCIDRVTWDRLTADEFYTAQRGRRLKELALFDGDKFHQDVVQPVAQLVEAQHVAEWYRRRPYDASGYRWVRIRRLAVLHRLLSTDLDKGLQTTDTSTVALHDLLRWTLILATHLSNSPPMAHRRIGQHMELLMYLFQTGKAQEEAWSGCMDLLLWITSILAIGVDFTNSTSTPRNISADLIMQAMLKETGIRACALLSIEDGAGLEAVLSGFLFPPCLVCDRFDSWVKHGLELASN